ncbi:MAG TPA: hypothetical protein VME19_16365 [Streptosporangiaceae bacterium]|nr:hypothetical protein [Streptosporangiaceae bacterium]
MNEDVGTKNGAGLDDTADMDARDAAAIMQDAGNRARRELRVNTQAIYACAGVAWLLGYGGMWLSVRGQRPYQGPTPAAAFIQVVLIGLAAAITASVVGRATSGVGGFSAVQRRVSILALVIGIVAVLVLEAAIDHAGASRSIVFGVFQAAAPVLVTGVVYVATSASRLNWPALGLGLWLIAVAAGGAFAGPVGVWGVIAVAGGIGFLLIAALRPAANR